MQWIPQQDHSEWEELLWARRWAMPLQPHQIIIMTNHNRNLTMVKHLSSKWASAWARRKFNKNSQPSNTNLTINNLKN